jgi:hypothetical protein
LLSNDDIIDGPRRIPEIDPNLVLKGMQAEQASGTQEFRSIL